MEHINKVELQGRVGAVRTNEYSGAKVANFSLATDVLYKTKDGRAVAETTWHQVVVWQQVTKVDVESVCKGDIVKVTGRLRTTSYRSTTGENKVMVEVLAGTLEMIESV